MFGGLDVEHQAVLDVCGWAWWLAGIPRRTQRKASQAGHVSQRKQGEYSPPPTKIRKQEVPQTLTQDVAQSLDLERAVEGRVLDLEPLGRAVEDPAMGIPAEDAVQLRVGGGDGLRGLVGVVGDVHGWVVAGFEGGLLGHALGSVAAGHRRGGFGFVGWVCACFSGLCWGGG